jgi:hypothetical protein
MKFLLLLFLFLLPNLLLAQTAVAPVNISGIYQIASLENLYWISASNTVVPSPPQSTRWGYKYAQTADIDASPTSTWFPDGSGGYYGWSPIGTVNPTFTGKYDGQGHTISNLYINRPAAGYVAFIGYTSNSLCAISNLGLVNINFTGMNLVGGILGYSTGSVANCYTTGVINGQSQVGGIIGHHLGSGAGTITNTFTTCTVYCTGTGGAFAGYISGSSLIKNCYSRGNLIRLAGAAGTDVSGFVGSAANAGMSYCYSTGSVTYLGAANPVDKGFLGLSNMGTCKADFWDTQTSLQSSTAGIPGQYATGAITTDMKNQLTYFTAGWDKTIWNMDPDINDGYPYLQWQNPGGSPLPVELSSFTASLSNAGIIHLNWITQTEKNSDKFIVLRKSNLTDWQPIAFVNASVLSNSPKQYSFNDTKLQSGKYQYKLKMIDNDGSFQYSKIVEADIASPCNFMLSQNYPNPFNPSTKISYTLPVDSKVILEVYNIAGVMISQLVNEDQSAGYYSVDFNSSSISRNLSSGVYFYRLSASDHLSRSNFSLVKKMIILK